MPQKQEYSFPMKKVFALLRLVRALIQINKNPKNVDNFFVVSSCLQILGAHKQMEQFLQQDSASLQLIESRKTLNKMNLENLNQLPSGSLGQVFAHHMLAHKLDPDFYPALAVKSDQHFVILRMRQTHDLLHVLTGFDVSESGELGIQGFMLAQLASPLSMMLIGGSLLALPFKHQERFLSYMESVFRGWKMGREAKPVFAFDWDANWSTPIEDIRKTLSIQLA